MTLVIFDPEAQAEFLASVKYYEDCQHGLGRRFRLVVESAIQKRCFLQSIQSLRVVDLNF